MRLQNKTQLTVIAKGTQQSRDGKNTYYRATVLQGMESGMLSCSQEVYDLLDVGKEYTLATEYNSEYKSYRIVGVDSSSYGNNKTASAAK